MKRKLLLLFLLVAGGLLYAQDTIRTLLITEAHLGTPNICFVEISNVGEDAIQLSDFELGRDQHNDFINADHIRLPDKMLQPGESFLVATVRDFTTYAYQMGIDDWSANEVGTPLDILDLVDLEIHMAEQISNQPYWPEHDSVSDVDPIGLYFGRQCVYLEQHLPNGDSVLIDQVMGVFDTPYGTEGLMQNKGMAVPGDAYDVAGYPAAGNFAVMIRKFAVKKGNMSFIRGTGEGDSEWLCLDNLSGMSYRMQPWTMKSHGDYNLDANTLVSDVATVDFANKTITVPWGTRRPDGIMKLMEKKPGIYWDYALNGIEEDSLAFACKTGDKLEVVVCGNDADRGTFDIIVSNPLASDNFIVPRANWSSATNFSAGLNPERVPYYVIEIMSGRVPSWPFIIDGGGNMDTLSGRGVITNLGIPYATRVDSLYERMEKAPLATWEIVPVDGNASRPDLMEGDILKVTAENGSEKEYYIQVQVYEGSEEAQLSSITWPDNPDPQLFQDIYKWKGDTIPNFAPGSHMYQIKLPSNIEQVPATVAKAVSDNAVVSVQKAINLASYDVEDRTTVYTVTAESDTTSKYVLEWQREQLPFNIQPYPAEPFVSEYVGRYYFGDNFLEVCNPGNVQLDLSNYMFVTAFTTNPAEAIAAEPEEWTQRYIKYVPGYKWVDSTTWATQPSTLEQDLGVNAVVQPGDVFCMSGVTTNGWWGYGTTNWNDTLFPAITEADVNFYDNLVYTEEGFSGYTRNPWGEPVEEGYIPVAQADAGEIQFLFKIVGEGGDSVKAGLKPATDPNDFELIEIMGMEDQSGWMFGQLEAADGFNFTTFIRYPEYVFPKSVLEESFGDADTGIPTEWHMVNRTTPEVVPGWPSQWTVTPLLDYGKHFFYQTTTYLSTVSSNSYKVSLGYDIEDIKGLVTGVTVEGFLPKLTKADENQTWRVVSGLDGSELDADEAISDGDTLLVTSADAVNTTKYVLDVSDQGLSSDAVITSATYTVDVTVNPAEGNGFKGEGTLSGFPYMTTLEAVVDNITLPAGATMAILNDKGLWVPVNTVNYDTIYVKTGVNDQTMLHVVAEDMVTTIDYWLRPDATSDDAMVYSDLFLVIQESMLIDLIPSGISVNSLTSRLYASRGASMKVVDRSGLEREGAGIVRFDDKLVVTSESGAVSRAYYFSFSALEDNPHILYVLSDVYSVDNVGYVIPGVEEGTTVGDFLGNLTPNAFDATMKVMDAGGSEKTDGAVVADDELVVSSADGKLQITYTLTLKPVSVPPADAGQIRLYPNPTSGQLHITGLVSGQRIQVYNQVGSMIHDMNVNALDETISLDNQPAGMYIIVVKDKEQLARYKVIKQ
ncbi:MAG: T9SS type A sorting domain-containing protein [Bacteroidota bacterium]